ncbi:MAG: ATG16 family protein [Thaumarchaeota archaeon]|nr:ATG16 family protein [Nitrososphaerota archaeon]
MPDVSSVCTGSQLQDRLAALEAEKATWAKSSSPAANSGTDNPVEAAAARASSDPSLARVKLDLAEALRSKGQLQGRLKAAEEELFTLKSRTTTDSRAIRTLTAERNALTTKVRDRDEEIREKQKLVEVRGPSHQTRGAWEKDG